MVLGSKLRNSSHGGSRNVGSDLWPALTPTDFRNREEEEEENE